MAKRRRGDGLQVADITDPPVAVRYQVADTTPHAIHVVGKDIVSVEKGWRAVDKHHRRARPALVQQVALVVAGGHDHKTVHPPRRQRRDQLPFAGLVFLQAPGEDEDAASQGVLLDGAVEQRIERVGDVLEDDADRGASTVRAPEAACRQVVLVVELLDGGSHAGGALS